MIYVEIPEGARGCRVGKILRMERQTERKRDGVGECTPSKYRQLATTSPFVLHAAGINAQVLQALLRTLSTK